jgi:diguanylate cyclase (GGDEF)-like protein
MELAGYSNFSLSYRGKDTMVYRCLREQDKLPVIVKAMSLDSPSEMEVARAKREYEILRSINLDGVIAVHDLLPYGHGVALVLEDFNAVSLAELIRRGPLPLDEILRIGLRLAETLGRLHQQGIIHRDIKPDNILINETDGRVKLIDFGISSLVSGFRQECAAPDMLEGTLAYISPEQTGRVSRGMDHRADLYSLGVTLYEICSGSLPFVKEDALELIHSHIAVIPEPLITSNPSIPEPVSEIIMRLMAKSADDRYRSGFGLKCDLLKCLEQLEQNGSVGSFRIGERDGFTFFRIPEKLYGREDELRRLKGIVDQADLGGRGLVLVCGAPGVGKTELIRELDAPGGGRILYGRGKFEQFRHDKPYSALIQAFTMLTRRLLGDSRDTLTQWAERLNRCWGENGRIVTELIPELEIIAGVQKRVQELPPMQAQNRFHIVFRELVKVFADSDLLPVLFLDDLQWADPATLKLLEVLLTDSDMSHFLCIGAYRDTEVGPEHPLTLLIDVIRKSATPVEDLILTPLGTSGVADLIEDAFLLDHNDKLALAEIVMARTLGNPFFVVQYLKKLNQDGVLFYAPDRQGWEWDSVRIRESVGTDNVVDFMCEKIARLPEASREILCSAAIIGNRFELGLLAGICGKGIAATVEALGVALEQGLALPLDDAYKYVSHMTSGAPVARFVFVHDRVQQAAFSLISAEEQSALHYRIGDTMLRSISEEAIPEHLFFIVDHLNSGVEHVETEADRLKLARLNFDAGKSARGSQAYADASLYLGMAMELLPRDAWNSEYELTMALHMKRAESEYLSGSYSVAENLFEVILNHSRINLEKAQVYRYRLVLYQSRGMQSQALAAGKEGLKKLGCRIPDSPGKARVIMEALKVRIQIGHRRADELLRLPPMEHPEKKELMALINYSAAAAYFESSNLFMLLILKMVSVSVGYGNTKGSGGAYGSYGLLLGSGFGDYASGDEFAQIAVELSSKYSDVNDVCVANFMFGGFVNHWRKPLANQLPHLETAYRAGLGAGEFLWAGYALGMRHHVLFSLGVNLKEICDECLKNLAVLHKIKHEDMISAVLITQQAALSLRGITEESCSLSTSEFNEEEFVRSIQNNRGKMLPAIYFSFKLVLFVTFKEHRKALQMSAELDGITEALFGQFMSVWHNFYSSLAMAALYATASKSERQTYLRQITQNQKIMKKWAENCPENFSHCHFLVAAELAGIEGRSLEAMDLYKKAVSGARTNGFLHIEAIANERASYFMFENGFEQYGVYHLREAHYCFERWGATAKIIQLEEEYPEVFKPKEDPNRSSLSKSLMGTRHSSTPKSDVSHLDIETVIKATQEISGEMLIDRLLEKMMGIVMMNAGAERGYLALMYGGCPIIRAGGSVDNIVVNLTDSAAVAADTDLAVSVMHYTARTRETLVIGDAARSNLFATDHYVVAHKTKSLFCLPVMHQGNLIGILYLENNLMTDAFTAQRVNLLNILAGQIAISIENALLYANLEEKVAIRTEELRKALEDVRLLSNTDLLTNISNRRHLFEQAGKEIDRSTRFGIPLSFLMLDIDFFKKVNDTYGHQTGDSVLRKVAEILCSTLRTVDVAGRIGGEEFAAILPNTSREGGAIIAERLRSRIEAAVFETVGGRESFHVTISIGGSSVETPPFPNMDYLYFVADKALYISKETGRNRVTFRSASQLPNELEISKEILQ